MSTSFTSSTALSESSATPSSIFIPSGLPHPTFPIPSVSSVPCNVGPCSPPPATLYLYTFLSTLILLLLLSSGIIARSVVLRRRQQIAVANGTWVPPSGRRETTHTLRPKPELFDLYIADGAKQDKEWGNMKPFSASDLQPPPKAPAVLSYPEPAPSVPARRAMREVLHSYIPFHAPSISPTRDTELAFVSTPPSAGHGRVRIATLVAMPSEDTDAEDLPYLEVGVLDADIADDRRMSSQSDNEGTASPGRGGQKA
ncbi:hypothetical protein B0H11DRAFT_2252602 [Mycena galericulata]|nr:hypothetical protein B0H11DRAFT_2252602 [Mycena galericulata]